MKKTSSTPEVDEPLGIIISHGERGDRPTRLSAYIWGPVPEPTPESSTKAA